MTICKLLCTGLLTMTVVAAAQTAPKAGEAAHVSEMAWMAGHWTGNMQGATVDRYCTQPAGGSIMCMMRVLAQNHAVWHEFSILQETPAGIVLRTRFFNADLAPDDPIETTLNVTQATATMLAFENPRGTQPKSESITSTGGDTMTSHAELIDSKGTVSAIDMQWTRAK